MMTTKIEWCDKVWNPVTGCSPVSEGCQNCYAKKFANRHKGRYGYPAVNPFQVTYHPDRLAKPYQWKKPRKIFVNSMGDLFHPDVDWEHIYNIMVVAENTPQHTYIILTKRPKIAEAYFKSVAERGIFVKPLKNVWLGVTAETQRWLWERVDVLMRINVAVRFVSIEPILSAVDIRPYTGGIVCDGCFKEVPHEKYHHVELGHPEDRFPDLCGYGIQRPRIDWVIAGPETGTGKRAYEPSWIGKIYIECERDDIPFFDKRPEPLAREFPE